MPRNSIFLHSSRGRGRLRRAKINDAGIPTNSRGESAEIGLIGWMEFHRVRCVRWAHIRWCVMCVVLSFVNRRNVIGVDEMFSHPFCLRYPFLWALGELARDQFVDRPGNN